jgi:ABC-type transport system involved in cytochrome c biogenesis permease component
MFGAEPWEPASQEEIRKFEIHAAARLKRCVIDAAWAVAVFVAVAICIIPFSAGHRLHRHWEIAKYIVWLAMALWAWLVYKVALIWAAWQSARETRREFQ